MPLAFLEIHYSLWSLKLMRDKSQLFSSKEYLEKIIIIMLCCAPPPPKKKFVALKTSCCLTDTVIQIHFISDISFFFQVGEDIGRKRRLSTVSSTHSPLFACKEGLLDGAYKEYFEKIKF